MREFESLSISNVRCFHEKQSVRFGRVTLVVGENSSGKSTLLGCCRALSTLASFHELNDPDPPRTPNLFDLPPFHLGNFDNVARRGESSFSLAASFGGRRQVEIKLTYGKAADGGPTEEELAVHGRAETDLGQLTIRPDRVNGVWRLAGGKFEVALPETQFSYREPSTWLSRFVRVGLLPFGVPKDDQSTLLMNVLRLLQKGVLSRSRSVLHVAPPPHAVERLRSFADMPLVPWDDVIRNEIAKSAKALGVFDDVEMHTARGSFVLSVKRHGRWFNILDVGYGVASILTLLHEMYSGPGDKVFFLQQPEVHVHPFAQAQLAELIARSSNQFLIETHSDHLIDRLMICVMERKLAPEELKIVYLEGGDEGRTEVYTLDIDQEGNVVNVPTSYRKFFLDEASRLMGLD